MADKMEEMIEFPLLTGNKHRYEYIVDGEVVYRITCSTMKELIDIMGQIKQWQK